MHNMSYFTHTSIHAHTHSTDPVTIAPLLDEPVTTKEAREGHVHDTRTQTHTAARRSCSLLSEAAEADGCSSVLLMRPSGPLVTERERERAG